MTTLAAFILGLAAGIPIGAWLGERIYGGVYQRAIDRLNAETDRVAAMRDEQARLN